MSEEHTYKFNVSMSCGGCSGAVDRVLKKLDGESTAFEARPAVRPKLAQLWNQYDANLTLKSWSVGVKSYEVSLENQTATVVAEPTLSYEAVLKTISKTGKKVNTGSADGEEKSVEVPA
jgi:copper chaperone